MSRNTKIFQGRGVAVIMMMAAGIALSGCQSDKELQRMNQEQAATIQALGNEISRLNQELDALYSAREDLAGAKEALEKKLSSELTAGDAAVSMQARGLVVTVLDRILFDSGKAELKPSSLDTLNKVGNIIAQKVNDHRLFVEGHTDNEPIHYSGWRSNWELSTARATEVIHYFVDELGINPEHVVAAGYGEYRPVASNETPEGRMKNRRVEIVISPEKMTSSTVPAGT